MFTEVCQIGIKRKLVENKKKNINNRVTLLAFVITNKLNKLFNHD